MGREGVGKRGGVGFNSVVVEVGGGGGGGGNSGGSIMGVSLTLRTTLHTICVSLQNSLS